MEYGIIDYGSMIADRVRMDAYACALETTVKPGDVVLDIGTGPGLMALLAWRLGAEQVIAIEPDDVIEVARRIADANGANDRLVFVQNRSTEVELSTRADVIVSDLRGVLPLYTGHIRSVVDARRRLLAPGGVLIPRKDTLWAVIVEAPSLYERRIACWSQHGMGLDLAEAHELAVNSWWRERIEESQVLSDRWLVATLDYKTVEDTTIAGSGTVTARRDGVAHGLSVWFDAELTEGIGFSNAPDQPETIYGNAFFPLRQPVEVEVGDVITIDLRAIPAGPQYVWAWGTRVDRSGEEIVKFRQSTALGMPLTQEKLALSSLGALPTLTKDGQRVRLALEMMAGELSLEEIAGLVSERFPDDVDTHELVARLAVKYGRV